MSKKIDGEDKFPLPAGTRPVGRPKEELTVKEQTSTKRDALAILEFQPSDLQERVKARFHRNLQEASHVHDLESVMTQPHIIEKFAGSVRIKDWLMKPEFVEWFLNRESFKDEALALRSKALRKINEILENEYAQDADSIKAAKLIFDITGSYPAKQQEVKFLDESLNRMSPQQVRDEKARLQAQLGDDVIEGEEV